MMEPIIRSQTRCFDFVVQCVQKRKGGRSVKGTADCTPVLLLLPESCVCILLTTAASASLTWLT